MRFSTALVILSAAFATTSAARLEARQGYQSCAIPCLTTSSEGCNSNDTACLCKDQNFVSATTKCFEENCSGDALQASLDTARDMCKSVGVTLSSSAAGPTSNPSSSTSSATSSPAPSSSSGSNNNSAGSNSVNVLFALSVLGLIGYAL